MNNDSLKQLFLKIAQKLNKSQQDLQPYIKILKNNWYQTQAQLQELSAEKYSQMNIPARIGEAIICHFKQKKHKNFLSKDSPQVVYKQIMVDRTTKLVYNLHQFYNGNRDKIRSILQVVYQVIKNIKQHPYENKFRKLKKSNKLIRQNFVNHPACLEYLKDNSFKETQQVIILQNLQIQSIILAEQCFSQIMKNYGIKDINHRYEEKHSKQNSQFSQIQDQKNELFREQKNSQKNYFDLLNRLVQFRQNFMSKAPNNRRLKIYHKKYQVRKVQMNQITMQKCIELSDDKIISNYWKQYMMKNKKSFNFQSKRKQQFEFLLKQPLFSQTQIKIRLPNQLIIQAYFGPLQKLKDVHQLINRIAAGEYYIYVTPPVKKLNNEHNKTLSELDSVPMGSFYINFVTEWYIVKQYAENIFR